MCKWKPPAFSYTLLIPGSGNQKALNNRNIPDPDLTSMMNQLETRQTKPTERPKFNSMKNKFHLLFTDFSADGLWRIGQNEFSFL